MSPPRRFTDSSPRGQLRRASSPVDLRATQLLAGRTTLNLALLAWIAMFCSILSWWRSELRAGELGDTSNYYRIALVLFAGGASVYVLMRNSHRLHQAFPGPLLLLLLYALAAMTSSLFIAKYAFYSMWKGFEVLVDVLTIGAILSYPRPQLTARAAYRVLLALYGTLVIVYIAEAVAVPSLAFTPSRGYLPLELEGVLPLMSANALAFLSALTALGLFCRLMRPAGLVARIGAVVLLSLAMTTLILAQSRTSVIGLALALLVYLFLDRRYGLLAVLVTVCLGAAMYTQMANVSYEYLLRGQDAELVTSLSGRTGGWAAALAAFKEAPLTGHGFAAFARANILGTTGASTLHGAVFDVMVGMGLIGLIPWVGAIAWTLLRLAKLSFNDHPWFATRVGRSIQAEMLGLMALILVRASTSSGLALHEDNFMLFLTVLAYACSMAGAAAKIGPSESMRFVTRHALS